MSKTIMINSLILSAGILIGRLSGYIREIIIASKFGASSEADTILLMLTVPDLLNNLLASGAVVGVLIPLLNEKKNDIEKVLSDFIKKLFFITLFFYLFIAIVIFYMYDFYLFMLLSISLLSIFPNIVTFVISGYLQFKQKFKFQSLNTLIFNIAIIVSLLFGSKNLSFALAIICASILRMLWIYIDLKNTPISYKSLLIKRKTVNDYLKYKTIIFMIFANGLMFINPMIDKLFAKYLHEGSVAILSYSEKIYLLPASVFLTTYAVAMFPNLSKLVLDKNKKAIDEMLKRSIIFNLFVSLIIGIIMYVFSYDIVNIFFHISGLDSLSIHNISIVLKAYIVTLVLAGTNSILINLIFAYKWYNKLILYSVVMVLLNIVLDIIVVKLGYGIEYIAYATSLVSVISIIYLYTIFKERID